MAYAARRNSSSVACCAIAIRCGTRYEEGFHSGTAHFAEHALFRGTSLKSARVIGSFLDRLGGDLNAYTTKEEIVIHATVLKEDVRKEVDVRPSPSVLPVADSVRRDADPLRQRLLLHARPLPEEADPLAESRQGLLLRRFSGLHIDQSP